MTEPPPPRSLQARHSLEAPAFLSGVLIGLESLLEPFDISAAIAAADSIPLNWVEEFGMESGLAEGGVDLAVRGKPQQMSAIPWLDPASQAILVAAGEQGYDSTWVEIDLTNDDAPTSAFVRGDIDEAWQLIINALERTTGIEHEATVAARRAYETVMSLTSNASTEGTCGSYPTRRPPVAGAALRVEAAQVRPLLAQLRTEGAITLDPSGPEVEWLLEHLDEHGLAVAASANGQVVCGIESRFENNIVAAREHSWSRVLSQPQPWAVNPDRIAALNALPGAWRYSGVLPTVLVTGVSHLKVSPAPHGSRAKIYFGGRIELGGVS